MAHWPRALYLPHCHICGAFTCRRITCKEAIKKDYDLARAKASGQCEVCGDTFIPVYRPDICNRRQCRSQMTARRQYALFVAHIADAVPRMPRPVAAMVADYVPMMINEPATKASFRTAGLA
jgi:hypothetical protein